MARLLAAGLLVAAVLLPPVSHWAHHDLRGHMLQHLVLGMFAPILIVMAAPGRMLLRWLSVPAARRVTRVLRSRGVAFMTHPATALTLDAGALWLLMLTPLFAAMHSSPLLGGLLLFHFLAAGTLFTWSIIGRDPTPHRASFRVRLGALFVAIAAHGTLAKLMYAGGWPRGTHHTLEEIRAAAELMYWGGSVAELLVAIALFAGWYGAASRGMHGTRTDHLRRARQQHHRATPGRRVSG